MGTTWRQHGDNMRTMWRQHRNNVGTTGMWRPCGDNVIGVWVVGWISGLMDGSMVGVRSYH